jgi:hypothetical protein
MKFNYFEKSILSIITLGTLTFFIIQMYIEKYDKARREIEHFTSQWKKKDLQEEPEYQPYLKQEDFRSNPLLIEGMSTRDKVMASLPIVQIVYFIMQLIKIFKTLPRRAKNFSDAFKNVGQGIKLQFVNLGKSLELGFDDTFDVIGTLGTCGITYLTNFRTCIMWYILDCIATTLFAVFVELPVFIILKTTGLNLRPYVDVIICFFDTIDAFVFKYTCYHIFHFPDWVIKDCYSCKFEEKVQKLNKDWKETIPALLNEPVQKFLQAKHNFEQTIAKY